MSDGHVDDVDVVFRENASHAFDERTEVFDGDEILSKSVGVVLVGECREFTDIV